MTEAELPRRWKQFDSRWSNASRVEKFILISVLLHVVIAFCWGIPKYAAYIRKQEVEKRQQDLEQKMNASKDAQIKEIETKLKEQEREELAESQLREFYEDLAAEFLPEDILEKFWDDILGELGDNLDDLDDFISSSDYDEVQAEEMIQDIKAELVDSLYKKVAAMTQDEWKAMFLKTLEGASEQLAALFKQELDKQIGNPLTRETENIVRNEVQAVRNTINASVREMQEVRKKADQLKRAIDQSNQRISNENEKITNETKRQDTLKDQLAKETNEQQTAALNRQLTESQARTAQMTETLKREVATVRTQEQQLDSMKERLRKTTELIAEITPEITERVKTIDNAHVEQTRELMNADAAKLDQATPVEALEHGREASKELAVITQEADAVIRDLGRIDADKVVREWLYRLLADLEKNLMQPEFAEAFSREYLDKALPELLKAITEQFSKEALRKGLMPPEMSIDAEAREILVKLPSAVDAGPTTTFRLTQQYKLEEQAEAPGNGELEKRTGAHIQVMTGKMISDHMPGVVASALRLNSWLPAFGPELDEQGMNNVSLLDRLGNMRNQIADGRTEFLGKGDHAALAGARQRRELYARLGGRYRERRSTYEFDKQAYLAMIEKMKNREGAQGDRFELAGESSEVTTAEETAPLQAEFILAPPPEEKEAPDAEADAAREVQAPEFKCNRFTGIAYLNTPITIDGSLADWKEHGIAPMDMPYVKGPAKEGFDKQELWMAYDANGLYFALNVLDTTGAIENHHPLNGFWFNDCIEIFIDMLNTKYSRRGESHTHQFFTFPFGQKDEPEVGGYEAYYKGTSPWMESWTTPKYSLDKFRRAAVKTDRGWIIEFMISKDIIRLGELKPGRIIGFNLSACTGSDTYFYWVHAPKLQVSTNPHSWGDIQFLGADAELSVVDKEGMVIDTPILPGEPLFLKVADGDMNLNTRSRDRVRVSVATSGGDIEDVVLEETEENAGIFLGAISTRPNIGTMRLGVLEIYEGESITVTYIDQAQAYGERDCKVLKDFRVSSTGTRFSQ